VSFASGNSGWSVLPRGSISERRQVERVDRIVGDWRSAVLRGGDSAEDVRHELEDQYGRVFGVQAE